MVSIPDWSRFQRGHLTGIDEKQGYSTSANRYERLLEVEAVRRAEEKGYFLEPGAEDLVNRFSNAGHAFDSKGRLTDRAVSGVRHIKLCYGHLKTFGDIGRFRNVRILNLSNNYLEHLQPLSELSFLMKLDIHSNQIAVLPDSSFWAGLPLLEILLLHDNPIGHVEAIQALAACPSLSALTLYDSPLSLKKNYRHHIVNTIWTLKAFDRFIISDEEIIEDAIFKGSKFASIQKVFEVNLSPSTSKNSSFEEEWYVAHNLICHINSKMAKFCPVLLLQKMIRGWITRRRFSLYLDSRAWAVITIQRSWRKYKHLPPPIVDRMPGGELPHSKAKESPLKTTSMHSLTLIPIAPNPSVTTTPRHSATLRKRSIVVDLAKLHQGTFTNMDDMDIHRESFRSVRKAPLKTKKKQQPKLPKKRKLMSVRQFFGPVVQPSSPPPGHHKTALPDISSSDTIPTTSFRLAGLHPPRNVQAPLEQMILSRKEAGQDVRDMALLAHDNMAAASIPPVVEQRNVKVKDKFMYSRLKETMGLSLLAAVHHAYRDRERDVRLAEKYEHVLAQQEKKMVTRERVRMYQSERRMDSLRGRDVDRKAFSEGMSLHEQAERRQKSKVHEAKAKREQLKARAKADAAFTQEFKTQQTSVSKALLRHDRMAKKEMEFQKKADKVEGLKEDSQEQHEIVNKFLEHRMLLRQTETAMSRAALDGKIIQETSDNMMEARKRVEKLKNRTQQVQRFYPLPHIPVNPPGPENATGGGLTHNTPEKNAAVSAGGLSVGGLLASHGAFPVQSGTPRIRFDVPVKD